MPDPDWYLDHVLVPSGPDRQPIGPARRRQAEWGAAVHQLQTGAAGTPHEAAVGLACRQGLVLKRDQARACGMTDAAVRSLVRRRCWSVPRYGVVCPLPPEVGEARGRPAARALQPHGNAVQIQAAAAALVRRDTVVSNESGAAMHGLPLLATPARPTLSAVHAPQMAVRPDVLVRGIGIRPQDTTDWYGTSVMTIELTVIDVARSSGVAAGLVAADAALHDGLTTHAKLADARAHRRYRPGVKSADRVLELATHLAESPLETLVRLCVSDGGLPAPEPQVWVDTDRGRYRVDLMYPEQRVIIEADGELKYNPDDPDALTEEKRRQEALERAGFVVVRVSWYEVMFEPQTVVARVRRKLLAAGS